MDKRVIGVLLIVVAVIVVLPILFAPIIPVQVTTTETREWKLLSYYKRQSVDDDGSYYVNVTNYDSVGGVYAVTLQRTSGPWEDYEIFEDTTQSMFIAAGDNGLFYAPESWRYFTIEVTIPTKQEYYNVTKTEYRSIIALCA